MKRKAGEEGQNIETVKSNISSSDNIVMHFSWTLQVCLSLEQSIPVEDHQPSKTHTF